MQENVGLRLDTFSHLRLKTSQICSARLCRLTATECTDLVYRATDYIFKDSNLCLQC